jgi:hypothetical protein
MHIQSIYLDRNMYFPISFLLADILPILNREFLVVKIFENFISFLILDMTLFIEKKNNVGLFKLKNPINYKFFFCGIDSN